MVSLLPCEGGISAEGSFDCPPGVLAFQDLETILREEKNSTHPAGCDVFFFHLRRLNFGSKLGHLVIQYAGQRENHVSRTIPNRELLAEAQSSVV
jgi:hypothetical protein